MSDDDKPRIDKVEGEFFRKGKCTVCGRPCERIKKLTGSTFAAMERAGADWGKQPLKHKRCER